TITPSRGFNFNSNDAFVWAAVILTIGCFGISTYLFRTQRNAALTKTAVNQKILHYQTAIITRDAPLNGASLFGIVGYMQTGNTLFIVIPAIIIMYFAMIMPTKDRVLNSLNLSTADLSDEPVSK